MSERFLLDTNVVSELARAKPDTNVLAFVASLDDVLVPASAVYELERGIRLLPAGKKRRGLERWLAEWLVPPVTVVPFDASAARAAARLVEAARRGGRPIATLDLFVLGSALACDCTIATRNVRDFRGHGVSVHDPFTIAPAA